jgi:leucyl aminopeptidase
MKISFSAVTPAANEAIALPVEKDGLDRLSSGQFDAGALAMIVATARASRFEGEAGGVVETFLAADGGVRRVLLLGVGAGGDADYERAGGALTAKLLTSGVESVAADFTSAGATPKAVARFAAGAAQRAWRIDTWRTRLPEKAKPTLTEITVFGAPDGTEDAWATQEAVTEGIALTRTLVSEPPNLLYPETFVAKVLAEIEGLGIEVTVLGEAEMAELGMGASRREP